jgi:hypothetical protein
MYDIWRSFEAGSTYFHFIAFDIRLTHLVGYCEKSRGYSGLQSHTSFGSARCDGPTYGQTIFKLFGAENLLGKEYCQGKEIGVSRYESRDVGTERNHTWLRQIALAGQGAGKDWLSRICHRLATAEHPFFFIECNA